MAWDQCCSCGNWPTIVQVAIHIWMGKYLAPEKSSPAQDNNWSLIHWVAEQALSTMDLGSVSVVTPPAYTRRLVYRKSSLVNQADLGSDLVETYNSIKCLGMVQTSTKADQATSHRQQAAASLASINYSTHALLFYFFWVGPAHKLFSTCHRHPQPPSKCIG